MSIISQQRQGIEGMIQRPINFERINTIYFVSSCLEDAKIPVRQQIYFNLNVLVGP